MRGDELQNALRNGEYIFGTCLEGYGQPKWPRIFSQIGLDFVFLDLEHTPMNRETVAWAAQAYAAWGVAPLLRIPQASPSYAAMALDLGAHGVVAPYMETALQVQEMIGAVKYRPLKGKGLQNLMKEGIPPGQEVPAYLADYNEVAVLWIMIESLAGIANLEEMLALGSVDGVLIGPHDLSISSGFPEQYDHPLFINNVEQVIQICQEQRVPIGIHLTWGDIDDEMGWLQKGCRIVMHSSDTFCFVSNMARELATLRERIGLHPKRSTLMDGKSGHGV